MHFQEVRDPKVFEQPVDNFRFPQEDDGSAINSIYTDEGEGFSETRNQVS